MLASINPLGERSRNRRFWATYAWYVAGSVVGGAALGGALGLVGSGIDAAVPRGATVTAALVLAVGAVALAFELPIGPRLPSIRRQVNEDWLARYRSWVYGGGFGFQLGLGVVTVVTTAAVYLTWALALLSGSLAGGLLVGATFGIVRALPLVAVARAHDPRGLRAVLRRVDAAAPVARATALASLLVVSLLGALAVGGVA
jgi:hypothetical protein